MLRNLPFLELRCQQKNETPRIVSSDAKEAGRAGLRQKGYDLRYPPQPIYDSNSGHVLIIRDLGSPGVTC